MPRDNPLAPRRPGDPVALGQMLADHALAVRAGLAELRIDLGAVHDARVALRRLRALLTVFEPVLEDVPAGIISDLRWLARRVAGTRDAEVMAERLHDYLARTGDSAAREIVGSRLAAQADEAGRNAVAALADPRTESLVAKLGRLHLTAGGTPVIYQQIRTQQLALGALDALCVGFPDLVQAPGLSDRRRALLLHERRKAAKAVRATTPVLEVPPELRAALNKSLRRLQNILGDHHDAAVVRAWMRQVGQAEPSTAVLVRDVRRVERAAMIELEARVPGALDRLLGVAAEVRGTPPVHLGSSY